MRAGRADRLLLVLPTVTLRFEPMLIVSSAPTSSARSAPMVMVSFEPTSLVRLTPIVMVSLFPTVSVRPCLTCVVSVIEARRRSSGGSGVASRIGCGMLNLCSLQWSNLRIKGEGGKATKVNVAGGGLGLHCAPRGAAACAAPGTEVNPILVCVDGTGLADSAE